MSRDTPRQWKRIRATVLALSLTLAGIVATAAPAQAGMSIMGVQGCYFSPPHYFCETGDLAAHDDHWIRVTVWAPRVGKVECSLYDSANDIRVGYVSRGANQGGYTVQIVYGLYARYYLICTNLQGYGAAEISN